MAMFNSRILWHLFVMWWQYTTQGVIGGAIQIAPMLLLHRDPDTTIARLGVLSTVSFCTAFKFLWAPLVDQLYYAASPWSASRRRAQWVVPLQLLMAAGFAFLWFFGGESGFFEASGVAVLVPVFAILSVLSATQDVAVDAWSVEGLHSEDDATQSWAGSVQVIGFMVGSMVSTAFIQVHTALPAGDPEQYFFGNVPFLLACFSLFSFLGGALAFVHGLNGGGALAAVANQADDEAKTAGDEKKKPSITRIWAAYLQFPSFARRPGVRAAILVLVSRAFVASLMQLYSFKFLKHGMDKGGIANIRMIGSFFGVFATVLASRVVRHFGVARTITIFSGTDYIFGVGSLLAYASLRLGLVTPQHILYYMWFEIFVRSSCGMINFNAVVTMNNREGMRPDVAAHSGTIITILNSMANFGFIVPSSLWTMSSDIIETSILPVVRGFILGSESVPLMQSSTTTGAADLAPPTSSFANFTDFALTDSIPTLALLTFALGLAARALILVPNIQLLEGIHRQADAKRKE